MPRPLRVAYVDHVARLSGAEIGLLRFLEAAHGIEATVLLAEDGPLAGALREAGARVEVLPLAGHARDLRRGDVRPGAVQARAAVDVSRYVARVADRLRALRPDLVHTNSLKAGVYGTLAARRARVPSVWHLHDRLAPDYLPRHAVGPMRMLVGNAPSAVVAPSRATLETAALRPRRRSAVIPFPIPALRVDDDADGTGPGGAGRSRAGGPVRRVGIVGRITPWKGQHVFLDGFARAFAGRPEVTATIVGAAMFGTEEEAYERSLREQAERLGIADRVDFRGFRADIAQELRRLDVLVHASTLDEPLGQVVLEGLAAGVPVVATAGGGAAEHVTDGVHALLYPRGDAAALAERLTRLADDPALRTRLAADGRTRTERFAPDAIADRMLGFYREVLAA